MTILILLATIIAVVAWLAAEQRRVTQADRWRRRTLPYDPELFEAVDSLRGPRAARVGRYVGWE